MPLVRPGATSNSGLRESHGAYGSVSPTSSAHDRLLGRLADANRQARGSCGVACVAVHVWADAGIVSQLAPVVVAATRMGSAAFWTLWLSAIPMATASSSKFEAKSTPHPRSGNPTPNMDGEPVTSVVGLEHADREAGTERSGRPREARSRPAALEVRVGRPARVHGPAKARCVRHHTDCARAS